MRYPYLEPEAPRRDQESMLIYMEEAVKYNTCNKGVKSVSPLIPLRHINVVDGMVVDYLHAALEGAGPQVTEYLASLLKPDQINFMDQVLLNIKAPNQITRLSRAFTERGQWKAREWENWILYYSSPLFTFLLQKEHPEKVEHWNYFVKSLHILLGNDISLYKLNEAHNMLHKFVKFMTVIYKDLKLKSMTYNIHQMLHIAKSVYDWGPLYTHSTFPFESGNMQVLQAIKCAKGVIQQVARYINLQYCLSLLEIRIYPVASPLVKEYCEKNKVQKIFKVNDQGPTYFGTGTVIGSTMLEKLNLSMRRSRGFKKMVKDGCLYSSSKVNNERSSNYYAQLTNGKFIKIYLFVIDHEQNQEFTICQFVQTKRSSDPLNHIEIVDRITSEFDKILTSDIRTVCVYQKVDKVKYICPVPNLYHY